MKLLAAVAFFFLPTPTTPRPNPGLAPAEVIRTVAEGLQKNDSPVPNAGIFTAYQFASPANRAVTGPYGRFLRLVRLPEFAPMLRDSPREFAPIQIDGDHAEQIVRILDPGGMAAYTFSLSRQQSGDYRGCWMVEGVVLVNRP